MRHIAYIHSQAKVKTATSYLRQSVSCDVLGQRFPNYSPLAKSDPREDILSIRKFFYKNPDLVESKISQNNHIT